MSLPVLAINGQTASGKTAVAVEVARLLAADGIAAEVVNADSMLVYRGMDIGTAKPTLAERCGVPHHLVDIMEVTQGATVADFQALARAAIADCRPARRGADPGRRFGALHVHAILDEFEFPGTDPAVRARLEAELDEIGPAALHARLTALAPEAAAGILPGNARRIVRALEVIELTGGVHVRCCRAGRYALDDVLQFGLEVPRDVLDARIEARVDQMWADGFVDEVRGLVDRGLREGGRPPGRSATARCWPSSTASSPRPRPARRPSPAPAGSPASSWAGSGAIRGSSGCRPGRDAADDDRVGRAG